MALTAEQAAARVDTLHAELVDRRRDTARLQDFFDGKQNLSYASDEFKKFHQGRYEGFADNWCEVVARAAPERMVPFGIRLGDDADAQSPDEKLLWRDWEINDGPAQSSMGFLSGAIVKRSAALVWGNGDDEPLLTWEHANQFIVAGAYSLKVWVEDNLELATLYTPEEVWKFQRPALAHVSRLELPQGFSLGYGGWRLREGSTPNPMSNPMGVNPGVEFPNRPMLGTGPISDIEGTVSMQEAINLFWAYLFGAADHASLPGRVVMGQAPPKVPILDANGQKVGEKPVDSDALTRGRMLWLTGDKASIGQFDSAKLDVFTDVLNVMVKHTASKTRTPIHYIMGELGNVNGETLTATELPLAKKVHEGTKHATRPMREVFRRLALARGNEAVAEACRTAVVQWANPETASDSQTADAAIKAKTVGWPFEAILERIYGLSQPEIQRVLNQRDAEGEADPIINAARGLTGGAVNEPADSGR